MTNESSPRPSPNESPADIINSITITDSTITRDPDSTHWMDNLIALPPCPLPDGDYMASVRDGVVYLLDDRTKTWHGIKTTLAASAGAVPDKWRIRRLTMPPGEAPAVEVIDPSGYGTSAQAADDCIEGVMLYRLAAALLATATAASQPGSTQEPPPGDRSTDISKLDPREQALERMAENARELGLDYDDVPAQAEPSDEEILAAYDGAIHRGGSVESVLVRAGRNVLARYGQPSADAPYAWLLVAPVTERRPRARIAMGSFDEADCRAVAGGDQEVVPVYLRPSADARDAARWRWLRDRCGIVEWRQIGATADAAGMDAAIDAFISQEAGNAG